MMYKKQKSKRQGFCREQPVTSVSWLLVNTFTVLKVETNTDDGEPINTSSLSTPKCNPFLQRPKWEKRLSIQLSGT